ncbi:MAG: hypothetical protein DMF75_00380 [Acidobacteria bacterium]|nr:MAG: hypothetical protein DMF75_00380 [Acidobacteriota bacterium]
MKTAFSTKNITAFIAATLALGSITFGVTSRSFFREHRSNKLAASSNKHPSLILWAWERPTDLTFIDRNRIAVAFLARTIHLQGNDVFTRPRLQPLKLPEGVTVVAVARVESDAVKKPELSNEQGSKLVVAITEMASLPNVASIQIDFDATHSERAFYREVIMAVRRHLPKRVGLSITALASWCMDDDWLSDLPIDEAVPMLFRMAADGKEIANRLDGGEDFTSPLCRHSVGISTDEPRQNLSSSRRLYVFSPDPWTASSVRSIMESRK